MATIRSLAVFAIVGLAAGLPAAALPPPDVADSPGESALSAAHAGWLAEVRVLLSDAERDAFRRLRRDYQRSSFIERFWQVRDPFPETPRNEFRDTWEHRVELARERFGGLEGVEAEVLLLAGPPQRIVPDLCTELMRRHEIWIYPRTQRIERDFTLVFLHQGAERYRLWSPVEGLSTLIDWMAGPTASTTAAAGLVQSRCSQGTELLGLLFAATDWESAQRHNDFVPRPDDEWVGAFLIRGTDLPDGAGTFPARVEFAFPGRRQSRTAVQGLIAIAPDAVEVDDSRQPATYNFTVDGEVLRGDSLFESFRYRFELPAGDAAGDEVPLVVQRYLRPGEYEIALRIEDRNSGRFHRTAMQLAVPAVARAPRPATIASAAGAVPEREDPAPDLATAGSGDYDGDSDEATPVEASVRILPPSEGLYTGNFRVIAATTGDSIRKVRFELNGRPLLTKIRPPYSVEIDLGRSPRRHAVEAVALDASGAVTARDRIVLNTGPHSFNIRLVEPQAGQRYQRSLDAFAEVEVPRGETLDRVEFYLDETLQATLFQEPFIQPILVGENRDISYVKAVAYLADGNSSHDVVFINTPSQLDQMEIRFVELYTSVIDRKGRPVEGLGEDDFTVFEEGEEQRLRRVDRVGDLPINAGIVLDSSTSMLEELADAESAAQAFFESVLTPKDRAAVVVFNDTYELRVPLTNQPGALLSGLEDLTAEGETALYDSLIYSLYYFSGLRGKRALILLTDGQDSHSRFSFEETLEFARRSGVAIYAIGIDLSTQEFEVVSKLRRLAHETGGHYFGISRTYELPLIYRRIEEELRSQYVLSYQSTHTSGDDFRRVEVKLRRAGLEAKTVPGYFP